MNEQPKDLILVRILVDKTGVWYQTIDALLDDYQKEQGWRHEEDGHFLCRQGSRIWVSDIHVTDPADTLSRNCPEGCMYVYPKSSGWPVIPVNELDELYYITRPKDQ